MIESARMVNAPLMKLMSKTLSHFKAILTTPDNNPLERNGIHNTVSVGRATIPSEMAENKDSNHQINGSADTEKMLKGGRRDNKDA